MWVKVDDSLLDHPKVHRAGELLGRDGIARVVTLYLGGLCYAARNLTDGFLPRLAVDSMRHVQTPLKVAESLVTVGLWEPADGGFQIHDFHHYQPMAAVVKEKRKKDRDRKAEKDSARNPSGNIQESERNPERTRGTGSDLKVLQEKAHSLVRDAIAADRQASVILEAAELIRWFNKIYAIYPNKDRKLDANRAWVELAPDLATATAIFGDVDARVKAGWKRFERRFIPQFRNYLSERMWEDANDGAEPVYADSSLPTNAAWQCPTCGEIHEGTLEQQRQRSCLKVAS